MEMAEEKVQEKKEKAQVHERKGKVTDSSTYCFP